MPSLGADMTEGTVLEWLVGPGDTVHRGDLVAVVKTDKADVEVEVFESGTIAELLAEVGETLPVGAPLATITAPGEAAPSPPRPVSPPVPAPPAVAPSPPPAPPAPPPAPVPQPDRIVATPYARKRAAELGIDLARLAPTQPGHPITATEVEQARTVPPAAPVDQASAMRLSIARLMARSKREIPHYYLDDDVDLTHTQHWLTDANRERSVEERLLPAAVFCKAVAGSVRHHSALNGFWIDDAFVPGAGVHLGVAIALRGGGLVAPALHDADTLSLPELMHALRDLTVRARGGRLRASEMTDATITVTMLGDQGVRSVFGVIFPPQVAIVGFGKVINRAWSADGGIGLRPVVNVTLAADHRATDGHTGARFLADIGRRLQHPEDLS
jgi:pyruvate dehydrogenase E2 component (dihydrolipoamide acetyltransferase)